MDKNKNEITLNRLYYFFLEKTQLKELTVTTLILARIQIRADETYL